MAIRKKFRVQPHKNNAFTSKLKRKLTFIQGLVDYKKASIGRNYGEL